jgi:putative tryptophan/tyrosine transport system substrate-binding protein
MFIHRDFRYLSRNLWRILIVFTLFALLLSDCGAKKAKVHRVNILSGLGFFADTIDGFKAKMTELGYIEGDNIIYDVQKTNDPGDYKRILEKFVADKVDLIFVFPTEAALTAKAVTNGKDIPVLFAHAFIEGSDLIASVRQPGGNITGVRFPGPDLAGKAFEILIEMAPMVKRVWVPYLQGYPSVPSQLEAIQTAAASLGVAVVEFPATSAADIEADLRVRTKSADPGLDAILFIYEPLGTWDDVCEIVDEFASKRKVPVGNETLFWLLVDNVQVGRQAAPMADKILKGTPAGTIPVASADSYLTINYSTAQEMGLTVPDGLLFQANKIIKKGM